MNQYCRYVDFDSFVASIKVSIKTSEQINYPKHHDVGVLLDFFRNKIKENLNPQIDNLLLAAKDLLSHAYCCSAKLSSFTTDNNSWDFTFSFNTVKDIYGFLEDADDIIDSAISGYDPYDEEYQE